jgi:hypothetical protein
MKFVKFKKLFLSFFFVQASYSAENYYEDGFVPRDLLAGTIQKNREFFLNHKFKNGETLVNLMPLNNMDPVEVEQDTSGGIRTLYVLNGWNITFQQHGSDIVPHMENSEKNLRLNRLDGQGFAKENSDGSITLGTINTRKKPTPVPGTPFSTVSLLSLPQELRVHNEEQQRQRRPEGLRDKEFSNRKPLIPHIPTSEELQAIAESKKANRQEQLTQLSLDFKSLKLELIKDEQSRKKIKSLEFGIPFLQGKIDNENLFNSSFQNLKKSVSELQQSIMQELRLIHSQSISLSDFAPSFDTDTLTKEAKEEADRLILKEAEKEESRLKRPNANPAGREEEAAEQENLALKKVPVPPYVFQNPLRHQIIENLKATSNEDSSYTGIKISRERLKYFVEFLEDTEHKERERARETIKKDCLRYYYRPDQGDGSHAKAKLGYGTKPIILSQQGTWLTTQQLKDLKDRLEQKGLL